MAVTRINELREEEGKVALFRGTSLRPVPPVESKKKDVRYFHIHENDQLDEKLMASWIRQAAALPGVHWF